MTDLLDAAERLAQIEALRESYIVDVMTLEEKAAAFDELHAALLPVRGAGDTKERT